MRSASHSGSFTLVFFQLAAQSALVKGSSPWLQRLTATGQSRHARRRGDRGFRCASAPTRRRSGAVARAPRRPAIAEVEHEAALAGHAVHQLAEQVLQRPGQFVGAVCLIKDRPVARRRQGSASVFVWKRSTDATRRTKRHESEPSTASISPARLPWSAPRSCMAPPRSPTISSC